MSSSPSNWSYAESPDLPEWAYDASAAFLVTICASGIICNATVIVALARNKDVSGQPENRADSKQEGIGFFMYNGRGFAAFVVSEALKRRERKYYY